MLPPLRLTVRLNATGSPRDHASIARSAAGRLARKTDGLVTADTSGTRSTREASAQRACISGLRRNASRAADGPRIPIGTRSSESNFRSLVQNAPIQEVEVGCNYGEDVLQ
jgi:hypothetical protein